MNGYVRIEWIYDYETANKGDWDKILLITVRTDGTVLKQIKKYESLDDAVLAWLCNHNVNQSWVTNYQRKSHNRTKRVVTIYFRGLSCVGN